MSDTPDSFIAWQRRIDEADYPPEPTWTNACPTQSGWYWNRACARDPHRPVEVVLAHHTGSLELWVQDNSEMRPMQCVSIEGGEWSSEPLTPPKESV